MLLNKQVSLAHARQCFSANNLVPALEVCNALIRIDPEPKAFRLRANIYAVLGDSDASIKSISTAIELSLENKEPCDFFYRGRWHLIAGSCHCAINDSEQVILLSAKYDDEYYLSTTYLHLAYCYASIMRVQEANNYLALLEPGEKTSINNEIIGFEQIQRMLKS